MMPLMDFQTLTLIISIAGIVWGHALYLNGQFSRLKTLLLDKIEHTSEKIINELESHEKYDDKRFKDVSDRLWSLRLEVVENKKKFLKENGQT